MKIDMYGVVFSIVWLTLMIWSYYGHVWGNLGEKHYRIMPRFFRQLIPGREADMATYVRFQKTYMKILGPIAIAFGVLILIASLIPDKS